MNRRFAHLTNKQLEKIRDTPRMGLTVESKRTLSNDPTIDQIEAVAELDYRHLRNVTYFALLVSFIAMIFAGIAACPVIQGWIPTSKPVVSIPKNQTSQQDLKSEKIPTPKKLPSVNSKR